MKKLLLLITVLHLTTSVIAQQNIEGAILIANTKRVYAIHLPAAYKNGTALPLMLIFHGGGGNYKQMQRYMNMDDIADKENFITVYPGGINKQWNDGREFKESIAASDDVQFITQLLDSLQKYYSIDKKRVFATGISNGGFFSIYLSYKLSERFAAVAPVCASIPQKIFAGFYPANPISILLINGTADPLVPYNGGPVGNRLIGSRGNCTATDSTLQRYLNIDHIITKPVITSLADADKNDQCTATQYLYSGGSNNTTVCLIKIINGGHTLPGGGQYLPKFMVGRVCNDFKGNEIIWNFFKGCLPKSN